MQWDEKNGVRRVGIRLIAIPGLLAVNALLEIFMHPAPVPIPFHAIALCLLIFFTINGKRMLKKVHDAHQREALEYLLWIHVGLMIVSGLGTVGWIIDMLP